MQSVKASCSSEAMDDSTYYDILELPSIDTSTTYSTLETTQAKNYEAKRDEDINGQGMKGIEQNGTQNKKNKQLIAVIIIMMVILLLVSIASLALSVAVYNQLKLEQFTIQNQQNGADNDLTAILTQLDTTSSNISQMLFQVGAKVNEQVDTTCSNISQMLFQVDTIVSELTSLLPKKNDNMKPQSNCGPGLWWQMAHLNMSDPSQQCSEGWVEENTGGVRGCGRGTVRASCQSARIINSYNHQYTKVCGRAIGYQYGHTDAFGAYIGHRTIDQVYVDGLSITYGSPRQHLWTYAAAVREGPSTYTGSNCPCSSHPGASPPSFLGNNWYCESGNPNPITPTNVLSNDPLWDGENCEGTCCSNGKSPPWFSVELPAPTNEYIEARICSNEHSDSNEDVFIKIFEIYIQ